MQAWFVYFPRFLADRHKSPLPPKVVLPSGVPIDLVRRTTAPPDSHRKQHRPFDDDLTSISAPISLSAGHWEAKAMALVNHHGGDVCHARTDGAKRQPAERTCRLYSIGVE